MTASCSWVWASQRRMVLSSEPEASSLPSALKATRADLVGVPAQDGDRGACGDVPEADGPVYSGGGEQAAVGMKSHVNGALLVSLESGDLPPRGHVPKPHRPLE